MSGARRLAAAPREAHALTPTIRPGRAADLTAIAALEARGFADPWPPELLASELTQPTALLLVAEEGGRLSGYAAFRVAAGEVELLRLAVAPERRRQGVASALVHAGLIRAEAGGAQVCFLEVRTTNSEALALYRALGFVEVGRRRRYYPDGTDALLLALTLPLPGPRVDCRDGRC